MSTCVNNMSVSIWYNCSCVLFPHPGYELERCDSPGLPVDLNSTLESQGTLDFNLVKNIGKSVLLHVDVHVHVVSATSVLW